MATAPGNTDSFQPTDTVSGIDVELKAYYTDSKGKAVEHPHDLRQSEKKLARASSSQEETVTGYAEDQLIEAAPWLE